MSTVFFDIDTQLDFVVPAGALYVPGAERLLSTIARLNRWAKQHGVPLISTVDAHAEDDAEFAAWPPHCICGTLGQRKPEETLAGQIIVEKRSVDCFSVPELERQLDALGADDCVVYGVVEEICVRHALMGLLARGRRVALVEDATQCLQPAEAARMRDDFRRLGGRITTSGAVTA